MCLAKESSELWRPGSWTEGDRQHQSPHLALMDNGDDPNREHCAVKSLSHAKGMKMRKTKILYCARTITRSQGVQLMLNHSTVTLRSYANSSSLMPIPFPLQTQTPTIWNNKSCLLVARNALPNGRTLIVHQNRHSGLAWLIGLSSSPDNTPMRGRTNNLLDIIWCWCIKP